MTAHQAASLSSVGTAGLHQGHRALLFNEPKDLLFVTVTELSNETLWSVASCADRLLLEEHGWEPLDDEVLQ